MYQMLYNEHNLVMTRLVSQPDSSLPNGNQPEWGSSEGHPNAPSAFKLLWADLIRHVSEIQRWHGNNGGELMSQVAERFVKLPSEQQEQFLSQLTQWREREIYWMPKGQKIRERGGSGFRQNHSFLEQGDAVKVFIGQTLAKFLKNPHSFVPPPPAQDARGQFMLPWADELKFPEKRRY